jgi:phage gp45-like
MTNTITQGFITNNTKDDQQHLKVQYSAKGRIHSGAVWSQYGLISHPPRPNRVLVIPVEGQSENKIVIASTTNDSKRSTPDAIGQTEPGEVGLHNQLTGSFSFHNSKGDLIVSIAKDQTITIVGDGNLIVGGNVTINVTGNINVTASAAKVTTTGDAIIDAPTVKIMGDLEVDGNITDNAQTNTKNMTDMRNTYNSHDHDETGSVTNAPNQPI